MVIQFKIRSSVLRRHRRPSLHLRSSISAAPCFNLASSSSVSGSLQHHGPDSVIFLHGRVHQPSLFPVQWPVKVQVKKFPQVVLRVILVGGLVNSS
ncbi:hypothetical protein ACFX13_013748 [Malus domestica]